jgi:uncharacterized protein
MAALATVTPPVAEPPVTAWWRIPIVWLVVGLPASAVIAATASGIIAVRHADPVVDEYTASVRQAAEESIVNGSTHGALEPAEAARNHAATPKR